MEQVIKPIHKPFNNIVSNISRHNPNIGVLDASKYTNGDISIYNDDCMKAFKQLADKSVDFIVTDPPYFIDGMGDDWNDKELNKKKSKAGAIGGLPVGMKFDPMQGIRLEEFFYKVSLEAIRVLKPGGFMVSFSQGRLFHRLSVACENAGFEIRDMLIWEHNGGQGKAFTQNHFIKKMNISEEEKKSMIDKLNGRKTPQLRPKFEPMLLAQKPKDGTFVNNCIKWNTGLVNIDFNEGQQTTIFKYDKPKKEKIIDHMTVKPVALLERLIEIFTVDGQTVLDPFLGSGTTGIASVKKNRKFIGFEIEKKYFLISIQRFEKLWRK